MKVRNREYRAVWMEGRDVVVINQPLLPHRFELLRLKNHRETARAIRTMIVRGAGTIGATAAYGLAQAYLEGADIDRAYRTLLETRPTAADLKHALDRVRRRAASAKEAVAEAGAIADEYVDCARRIAKAAFR
jgi:methylthioribose-1-phosphate isomerase